MDCKIYFLFFAILILFQRVKASPVAEGVSQTPLQNFVEPESYNLSIFISQTGTSPSISGEVRIKVRCVEVDQTFRMILNAKDMAIVPIYVGVSLIPDSGPMSRLSVLKSDFYDNKPDSGLFVIEMEEALLKDKKYELYIPFTCNTHSTLFEEQLWYHYTRNWIKEESIQVASKLTPGGASQLFPCFEETNVKTKFKIAIAHDKNMAAVSNWPLQPQDENSKIVYTGLLPNQIRDEFQETEPMLPSGVSFAVVDLKPTELNNDQVKVLIRIWSDERSFDYLDLAKGVAMNALLFYLEYFKTSLDSTKLDIIALSRIERGEIDKLGSIKLEESSLLFSHEDDQKYFDVTRNLCFAINHQWIGTTVTFSDPKDDYFHHALTYFLEEICINKMNLNSDFNFIDLRNVITFNYILMPSWDKPSYSEFESVFNHKLPDGKTQKAHHLFRMLFSLLKEKIFQDSLVAYVKDSKYSFSSPDDLWEAFTTEALEAKILDEQMSVKKFMEFYLRRNRFPLIRMEVEFSTNTVTISQGTFRFLGEKKGDVEDLCWPIPLNFNSKTGRTFDEPNSSIPKLLTCDKTKSFTLDLEPGEWIIVNSRLNVLGHTYIDDGNWELIKNTLFHDEKFENLDELTRANLLLDMFALAETGEVPYKRVFETMSYLSREPSAICLIIALTEFNKIDSYLQGETELLKLFQKYVSEILGPLFGVNSKVEAPRDKNVSRNPDESLTSVEQVLQAYSISKKALEPTVNDENEPVESEEVSSFIKIDDIPQKDRLKKELKKLFVKTACHFDVGDCEDQCLTLYEIWRGNIQNKNQQVKEIPAEIQDTVLCHTIKWSPKSVWNDIWKLLDSSMTSKENDNIYKALGCSKDENTLKEYLNAALEETYPGDHLKAFVSLSSSDVGYSVMKTYLMENVHDLNYRTREIWSSQSVKLEMYFAELFSITTKSKDMTELVDFTRSKDVAQTLGSDSPSELLKESMERANRNISWLEKHRITFSELLNSYK